MRWGSHLCTSQPCADRSCAAVKSFLLSNLVPLPSFIAETQLLDQSFFTTASTSCIEIFIFPLKAPQGKPYPQILPLTIYP